VEVHLTFKLMPETLFLAIDFTDRFLSENVVIRKNLQVCQTFITFIPTFKLPTFIPRFNLSFPKLLPRCAVSTGIPRQLLHYPN